jgi:hypothetical protein
MATIPQMVVRMNGGHAGALDAILAGRDVVALGSSAADARGAHKVVCTLMRWGAILGFDGKGKLQITDTGRALLAGYRSRWATGKAD